MKPEDVLVIPRDGRIDRNNLIPAHETQAQDLPGLRELASVLSRSRLLLSAGLLGGAFLALGISLLQQPRFEAQTSLEVHEPNADFLNARTLDPKAQANMGGVDRYLDTQSEILQSRTLIRRVLAVMPPGAIEEPPNFLDQRLAAVRAQWKRFALWVAMRTNEPQNLSADDKIDDVLKNLTITTSPTSEVIKITYLSTKPATSADFVNMLATLYIEQSRETRWNSSKETGAWLRAHTDDFREELARLEQELETYSHSTGLMLTSDKEDIQQTKLRDLQNELTKVQTARVQRQAEYEGSQASDPGTITDVIKDPSLTELQSRQSEMKRQLADLLTIYTQDNARVQRLQAQLSEVAQSIAERRSNVVSQIRNSFDSEMRREQLLREAYVRQSSLVSEQSGRLAHLSMLRHEVESRRQIYDSMLRQVQDAAVVSTVHASVARVIDYAVPPAAPSKPRIRLNALAGGFSGLIVAIFCVSIRERMNGNIRKPGELLQVTQVRELGVIPSFVPPPNHERKSVQLLRMLFSQNQVARLFPSSSVPARPHHLELETWEDKPSLMAESFRAVSTSLQFLSGANEHTGNIFTFTSPGPAEGKTTVLANIGIAQAELGKRVLLVDCDLRRPRLHTIFDLHNRWGLTGLLTSNADLETYPLEGLFCPTQIPGLFVVPSGPPLTNISKVLNSARWKILLRRLSNEFALVLLDTPPVLLFADARVLAKSTNGVVLVTRSNQTSRGAVLAAAERLTSDGTTIVGTVLNAWQQPANSDDYYYAYNAARTQLRH